MVAWEKLVDAPSHQQFDATSDYTFLLIQDWLQKLKLHATLSALTDECLSAEMKAPAPDKWYEMASLIDHANFVQGLEQKEKDGRALTSRPLLEMLIYFALAERQKAIAVRTPLNSTVFVTKRLPPMHGKRSGDVEESNTMRPKSAAVCKSTSALLLGSGETLLSMPPQKQNQQQQQQQQTTPVASARPASSNAGTSETARTNRQKEQGNNDGQPIATERSTKTELQRAADPAKLGRDGEDCNLEFDEMNENQISKRYGSLPKNMRRQIHRVAIKSSASSQQLLKSKEIIDKIQFRSKQRQMEHAISENSNSRIIVESYYTEPCSLCEYHFPKRNLTMRVSYKSIYDLRASWAAAQSAEPNKPSSSSSDTRHFVALAEYNSQQSPHEQDANHDEEQEDQQQEASRANRAHFYDEVPICVFCSQLVLNFKSYRPTRSELKQREIDRLEAESRAQEEEKERRRNRFDPLDFDPTVQDEEPDNDTEEVWLPDADGRLVLAQRRKRRPNIRVTVPTSGAAAMQIHYANQHLDSASKLNANEWHIIRASETGDWSK